MSGETDIAKLIRSMEPILSEQLYVFGCLQAQQRNLLSHITCKGTFEESEGLTVIVEKCDADAHNIVYQGVFKCITLNVHSSLEAVGLTAAFANTLAENGISANVVAGFYHDHIFVPESDAKKAMSSLIALSESVA